jgi:16S rRNA (uracil1498-N3)-methyltransferase
MVFVCKRLVAASPSYKNLTMPRFFCEQPITENSRVALDARVAQHVRVLRLRESDVIELFDGAGGEVPATISDIGKRDVFVETKSRVVIEREAKRNVTLYAGLIANDRFDWLIQKAVELGVAEIQPLYTERSQRIPGDIEKRVVHWRGVVIAACEQCGRNRLPKVNVPISIDDALKQSTQAFRVLMDAEGERAFAAKIESVSLSVFVGPEGGFASKELKQLRESCSARLRIGETILRAETAAIAVIALLSS